MTGEPKETGESTAVIVATGVSCRAGRTTVLEGVDLVVHRGEALLIGGRNGSGKSALLRVLAGLERPASGSVAFGGRDRQRPALTRSLGHVPEWPTFEVELCVREVLGFHARCAGLGGQEAASAVASILELVDLFDRRDRSPATLSRGERQRLALARALVRDPEVLLLDEPLAPLDPAGQAELVEVLYELKAMGKTVVVATQSPAYLSDWADTLALIRSGRLAVGPTERFLSPPPGERVVSLVLLDGAEAAISLLEASAAVAAVQREPTDGEEGPGARLRLTLRQTDAAALADLIRALVLHGVPLVEVYGEAPTLVGVE